MKKYKFITIKQINDELFDEKPVYRIFNNKNNEQIGILSYYKDWKKYVFTTRENYVFDVACLKNIVDFLENKID